MPRLLGGRDRVKRVKFTIVKNVLMDLGDGLLSVTASLLHVAVDYSSLPTYKTLSHLLLLRLQPGYLDRLIDSMHDLKRQADRAKTKMVEATATVKQAENELTDLHKELVEDQRECKELVRFLEENLSKLYDREIRLIGSAIAV
ncbi:unnamed protein product [Schistocephalus solidus]|uniref:Rx_N domain-containing protein n=1 Tax=Schistocephalus solidus TaxID=70667 RepID=A0A183SA88_SCHSO|nr:unnamed protein product [Schistocephalus solidus]